MPSWLVFAPLADYNMVSIQLGMTSLKNSTAIILLLLYLLHSLKWICYAHKFSRLVTICMQIGYIIIKPPSNIIVGEKGHVNYGDNNS